MIRRAWLLTALPLVLVTLLAGCGTPAPTGAPDRPPEPPPRGGPSFGTLLTESDTAAEEARGGVTAAMVEVGWRRVEPREGQFDEEYIRGLREHIAQLRGDGRTVTLDLAVHYAPDWILEVPDGRLVDDQGNVADGPNMIFNQRVRDSVENYLRHVAAGIDLSQVDAIRLSAGWYAEVFYPDSGHYWAFDRNAQNGPDLPRSLPPNPLPGWRPGTGDLSIAEVHGWADWYVGALADVVNWQVDLWTELGYRNVFEVLTPGSGVRPRQYEQAVAQGLPPGLLGTGGAWDVLYARLTRDPRIVAYVSSVADNSGGNDSCTPTDGSVPLDAPEAESWSATRWIARVARANGFAVSGENPGSGQPGSFGRYYADQSPQGMMASAIRQARSCGFRTFYWAHDRQLWDGTIPFAAYAEHVAG